MRLEFAKELSGQDMDDMVVLLNQVAIKETTMGYHEALTPAAGRAVAQGIDGEIRQGTSHVLVARSEDDRIVGMITISPQKLPARRHIVEMKRCVIREDYRGTMLLDGLRMLLDKTEDLGCDLVVIDVRSDGPEMLWRRLGFQEFGRLADYARVRGKIVAGVFMHASVSQLREIASMTRLPPPRQATESGS
jgi:predicted GNAT family N-acyltransferase